MYALLVFHRRCLCIQKFANTPQKVCVDKCITKPEGFYVDNSWTYCSHHFIGVPKIVCICKIARLNLKHTGPDPLSSKTLVDCC